MRKQFWKKTLLKIRGFVRCEGNLLNDTGPDSIIYLGESRDLILRAFAQAFCWMNKDSWDEIPRDGRHGCDYTKGLSDNINQDEIVLISHSLGSRIIIDGLTRMVSLLEHPEKNRLYTL